MDPILDRRHERSERAPVRVAVQLHQGDVEDAFEAAALNVSKGGISMRASCLPDVHSRLICRFSCMPSGTSVTAQGEVVWAHLDGPQSGEFGLAFIDLDPETEWLIEEMIAEHAAQSREPGPGAPVARLELEGSPEPIAARMASREAGRAVFEQELDLLSLGRGVLAHAPGAEGRAGSIAAVELRMVGSVPMLAVTVAFSHPTEAGELSAPEHDTEPDLAAPDPSAHASTAATRGSAPVTVTEFHAGERPTAPMSEVGSRDAREQATQAPPAWALSPLDHPPPPEQAPAEPRTVDFSHAFALEPGDDDSELDAELAAFSGPSIGSLWAPVGRALTGMCAALFKRLDAPIASASHKAVPTVRGGFLRSLSLLQRLYARQLAPQLGAMRRLLQGLLPSRRRRTTAGPSPVKRAGASTLSRTLALGMLGAGAAGLAVYALTPSSHGDAVDLGRHVQPQEPPLQALEENDHAAAAPLPHVMVPVAVQPPVANAAAAPSTTPAPALAPATHPQAPTVSAATAAERPHVAAVPVASKAPPASPFTVDVRPNAGVKTEPTAPRGLRFGAVKVPKGQRFSLRMSGRVTSFQGTPDKGGFSLTIPGVLSLDRAGPISAAVKTVQRAVIMNKGDHAELSIRFTDGKQPAYQVTAEGSTLFLVIEDN